jgi:hypothetical protein
MKKVLATIPILGVATIEVDVADDATDDDIFDAATEAFDSEMTNGNGTSRARS